MTYAAALSRGCLRGAAAILTAWLLLAAAVAVDVAPASVLRRLPSLWTSLWGGDGDDGGGRMAELRPLIHSSSGAYDNNVSAADAAGKDDRTASWSEWHARWSALSDADLGAIAYDASSLKGEAHRAWGAAYLGSRRIGLNYSFDGTEEEVDERAAVAVDDDDVFGLTAFLRGAAKGNDSEEEEEAGEYSQRHLSSWTMHGAENDPVPGHYHLLDPLDGLAFGDVEEWTADAPDLDDAETDRQALRQRLDEAMRVYEDLDKKHRRYDTNDEYSYSDPGGGGGGNDNGNGNDNGSDMDDMQQFSHTTMSSRQRMLTGSYAAWQWYDRDSLASPSNLRLQKVSRVNYAFFQTDADGYIFGTDSWADPNVLFGPYEFIIRPDELPEGCRGGEGRDDGKDGPYHDEEEGDEDFATDPSDVDPPSSGGGRRRGERECEYFEQCHRNFPGSKSCNIHKYREGLIYRAHRSGAQVYPSIGGWTLSGSFPAVAASPGKRKRFAKECVGLIADYGFDGECSIPYPRAGAAVTAFCLHHVHVLVECHDPLRFFAHIVCTFVTTSPGIEIDWEYPGYEPHGGSSRDRDNFNKLLLEVREALNDYQSETGETPLGGGAFGLTAALPCGPANIDFLDVPYISNVLSGMNLMTFDFHSQMEAVTGANSPLYDQEWDEEEGLSVDGCVKNYYEAGAGGHANKISIG